MFYAHPYAPTSISETRENIAWMRPLDVCNGCWPKVPYEKFYYAAHGFENVEGKVTGDGTTNKAVFWDSQSEDTFTVLADSAEMTDASATYKNTASGFNHYFASADYAGPDKAILYARDKEKERFDARPGYAQMYQTWGSPRYVTAKAFDLVTAIGQGGNDDAILRDSSGNDRFVARPGVSYLTDEATLAALENDAALPAAVAAYYLRADGFKLVTAYATSRGNDTATFYDSAGDDTFAGHGSIAELSDETLENLATYKIRADGFARVEALAVKGGSNKLDLPGDLSDLNYLFAKFGEWLSWKPAS